MKKSNRYRINKDIYEILLPRAISKISVQEIRREFATRSTRIGEEQQAMRAFISRELKRLERTGLIVGKGYGAYRIYHKTLRFYDVNFFLTKRRDRPNKKRDIKLLEELEKERSDIEFELAAALTEVDEYNLLMERFVELKPLLTPFYNEANNKTSSLVAKLNVRNKALNLITKKV
ncbi:conserved hypothetical protein [Vibrio chagasii]|nr:conserved hypothetical protein [Vibrio chagasii]CAH7005673.1 conserved hypothetical protein [Vibrio chagasii]CAH7093935.1 conserved hypothetical protein [Vibrio chagasii]CAH7145349.1 conserved hypothetical protein [Vibrio chagasii]CAH7152968.1 conserved hypothetical protein [Vibrio chagasii]